MIYDPGDYEADGKSGEKSIEQIAQNSTESGEKTSQPALVEGALDDQSARRNHWG